MTFKTRLSVLLVSTPVLAFVLIGGLMGNASARTDDQAFSHLRVFQDVVSLVMSNYVEEVKVDKVMEGAMRGLAEGLDPDSAYLTAQQVREIESGAGVPEGDLGIELTRQYYLRVIAARDGSPAAQAGLQTGDYVRAIDGKSTRDLSVFEGRRLLRGAPGSKVSLTIIRGNAADPHDVSLVREKATAAPVTAKMLGTDVGYIRIPAFTAATAGDVKRQAAELASAGATALLVDVRRTAEGEIAHGIATARLFVKAGTLASKAGRAREGRKEPEKEPIVATAADAVIDLPMQLLVSAGTSGAAEVFAAALDGNKRTDLIGEHTIGRAAEQKLVKLFENRGLWLTHLRYYAPGGELIHGAGLKPDVPVDEPDVEFGAKLPESDPMLEAALARVRAGNAMISR
ncbi:MAG: PDZ domain-containing protein [Acidobacteria bacterium]|nr:PDZ domain-containing protein [Acidobacteriota bacterium]